MNIKFILKFPWKFQNSYLTQLEKDILSSFKFSLLGSMKVKSNHHCFVVGRCIAKKVSSYLVFTSIPLQRSVLMQECIALLEYYLAILKLQFTEFIYSRSTKKGVALSISKKFMGTRKATNPFWKIVAEESPSRCGHLLLR